MTPLAYMELKARIIVAGYSNEVDWCERAFPACDSSLNLWSEYSWVILNSGMKNQVARLIWDKVNRRVVEGGGSASDVFGHKGKAQAIDNFYRQRFDYFETFRTSFLDASMNVLVEPLLAWCRTLPWIGPITCYHLAKNLGADCAKPDRHLVRIAGALGTTPERLCAELAGATGDRIGTVDYVIWRAANLGWV